VVESGSREKREGRRKEGRSFRGERPHGRTRRFSQVGVEEGGLERGGRRGAEKGRHTVHEGGRGRLRIPSDLNSGFLEGCGAEIQFGCYQQKIHCICL